MPTILNASTSSGLVATADTSGVLQLQTANTTAVTIDASQNVGIGTASPTTKLDVNGNIRASASFALASDSQGTVLQTSGNNLYLDGNAGDVYIRPKNVAGNLYLTNSARLQVPSTISVGGAAIQTSGSGVAFPATQSASSDANTLDDYEEGTFTPVPTPGSGSITAYTSSGNYTKIGRQVTVSGQVTLTTVGTASGVLNINGFSFAFANFTERAGYSLVREDAATGVYYALYGNGNATTGVITTFTNGAVVWTNGYRYSFAFTYQTN